MFFNQHRMAQVPMLTIDQFWKAVSDGSKDRWKQVTEFILNQFGTNLSCNRFAVGEVIEDATGDFLKACNIAAECVPSEKRIDINITNVNTLIGLSSKFVSTGNHVILYNAQRSDVKDYNLSPTLLFLMNEWWFLYPPLIAELGINVKDYMNNTKDSLQLSFNLLNILRERNYPYHLDFNINYDKSTCLMKATSDLTYKIICDLHNPETPPAVRNYLQSLLDSIPSRRVEKPPKMPKEPRTAEQKAASAVKAAATRVANKAKKAASASPPSTS